MTVIVRVKGEESTLSYKEWKILSSDHPLFVAQHRSMQLGTWGEGDTIVYNHQVLILKNLQFTPAKHGYQVATFELEAAASG
ncbi:hypothetical protein [Deinococcus sp. QL22]|uniref:hypothetical protein n=1 Tax=Deinococcus sp. QL22 TaxID=2939437 RepID=UPI002016D5A5|nr:hypothetical protein [Deinococcus sp. QL22]UQN10139.1 hypothetical protein M1R55_28545 [Deinococcus sp. QL22]